MTEPPEGIESLEAVIAAAKPNATITLPAEWIGRLLDYLRSLQKTP
jgi:hypothetical protein